MTTRVDRRKRPLTPFEQRLRAAGVFYLLWDDDAFLMAPEQADALGLAWTDEGIRSARLRPDRLVVVRP